MFITRYLFEQELEKAREEGYHKAMEQRNTEEQIHLLHERIDSLRDMINKPKTVSGFGCEVTPNA